MNSSKQTSDDDWAVGFLKWAETYKANKAIDEMIHSLNVACEHMNLKDETATKIGAASLLFEKILEELKPDLNCTLFEKIINIQIKELEKMK